MNVNRLINRGVKMLMRKGIDKGIDMAATRGQDPSEMTPEDREQAKSAKQTANKAKKTMRAARRFMR